MNGYTWRENMGKSLQEFMEEYKRLTETGMEHTPVAILNSWMRSLKEMSHNQDFLQDFVNNVNHDTQMALGCSLLRAECIVEKKSVLDFLENDTSIIDEKIDRCTPEMLKELQAMQITPESHILLVGAGAMPISAAVIHRSISCQISCLDIDEEALDLAQRWLQKMDCNTHLSFLKENIFSISDFSAYSHILLTGHINNKNDLLQKIKHKLNGQTLLIRNALGVYQYVYDQATNFHGYEIMDLVDHHERMPYHSLVVKHLPCVNVTQTPNYRFHLPTVYKNYEIIRRLLYPCNKIYYALKANGEPTIIHCLHENGVPFEVCSLEELHTVQSFAGMQAEIICSLPVKPKELITDLYLNGCRYFVFDSWKEYDKLEELAPKARKIVRLDITDLSPDAIAYGMRENTFWEEYKKGNSVVNGVTFYNNPNISPKILTQILYRCAQTLERLTTRPRILNIGGNYRFACDVPDGFYQSLCDNLLALKSSMQDLIIYAEPGRTIVKSAGMIVTKVVAVNHEKHPFEVYIDAGIPSGVLYPPKKIGLCYANRCPSATSTLYHFYAVTCSKKLLFSAKMHFSIKENDVLILEEMGTYSFCKANHFHGWNLPQAMYVSDEKED